MTKNSQITVGDALVRFSNIYEVFDIQEKKRQNDVKRIIFYKQVYSPKKSNTPICSIPEDSLDKTNIRKPLKEKEIDQLLKDLSDPKVEQISFKKNTASKRLNDNVADEIVTVIKNLWADMQGDAKTITMNKKSTFASARDRLAQEVAYVKSLSLEEAEELIEDQLAKAGEITFTSLAVD